MKKHIILIMLMLVSISLFGITDIYVKNPCCGQTVYKNTVDLKIRWDHTSKTGDFVKIRLFDSTGNTKIFGITDKTKNDGEFTWTKSSINGINIGDYVIRVKSLNDNYWDDSDVFHLRKKSFHLNTNLKFSKKPIINPGDMKIVIKISNPVENGAYEADKPLNISWNNNFKTNNTRLNIMLINAITSNISETISLNHLNTGSAQWVPAKKYGWPGSKYRIKIQTIDNKIEGVSGDFSIFIPTTPPEKKEKVIAANATVDNKHIFNSNNHPDAECLFASLPLPGRPANPSELKTGHFIADGKDGKCSWLVEYYFYSNLTFNITKAKGKEIVSAKLLISLADHIFQGPSGTHATNQYCSSTSKIFAGNQFIKNFSITEEGGKQHVDLLDSIRNWAASTSTAPYSITVKGMYDYVPYSNSVCLRYYSRPILFVKYKE